MSWLEFWAFLRYDLRLTEEEANSLPPYRIMALAQRHAAERKWLACRMATLVQSWASRKDGTPLRHRDIYPECDH